MDHQEPFLSFEEFRDIAKSAYPFYSIPIGDINTLYKKYRKGLCKIEPLPLEHDEIASILTSIGLQHVPTVEEESVHIPIKHVETSSDEINLDDIKIKLTSRKRPLKHVDTPQEPSREICPLRTTREGHFIIEGSIDDMQNALESANHVKYTFETTRKIQTLVDGKSTVYRTLLFTCEGKPPRNVYEIRKDFVVSDESVTYAHFCIASEIPLTHTDVSNLVSSYDLFHNFNKDVLAIQSILS